MPALAATLVQYSDEQNARTYTTTGHTVAKPKLVIQKRKVGTVGGASGSDTINVVYGTTDPLGAVMPGRVVFEANIRRPVEADATDLSAALALIRDIVASDEFAAVVTTQNYLK